jgi:NAD(P)-dependent dehydrogenase (short-subunit alcohol dehydrogenase family)
MSLIELFKSNGPSGFGYGSTAEQVTENLSLEGKNILVTGCNSGLGAETIRVLAKRGARILGTARTLEKAKEAVSPYGSNHIPLECELANPASVQACVDEVKKLGIKLDAIIANAGIMALPKLEKAYGYDLQFFTNHIGHFILVTGLLDSLTETGRVVMLSSDAHKMAPKAGIEFDNLKGEKSYSPWSNYGQSKFANVLFARELARKFKGTQRTANAVHPGVIQTKLQRSMNSVMQVIFGFFSPLFLKTLGQGAATQVYVATHPSLGNVSGEYFADNNIAKPRKDAGDAELAKKLWEVSEKIVSEVK